MGNLSALAFMGGILLATSSVLANPLLVESFETGDMAATNPDGFDWQSNNKTSVVNAQGVVYNNGPVDNPIAEGKDWTPKDGDYALRFRYPVGNHMSEQRFRLGGEYENLWLQYWLRVPTNYFHGQESPNNHKLFALWMDGYSSSGDGGTVLWEFWGDPDGSSRLAFHYNEGGFIGSTAHEGYADFISVPGDRGRWMEITIHAKASSGQDTYDGVIELWRRWENESAENRTLVHRKTDAKLPLPATGPQGWAAGYFMGWANSAYSAEETEWLMDHLVISTESLENSEGLVNANNPRAPVLLLQ